MARISDDDIRRVREATDLVSLVNERVVLTQKGRLFWGCCPFHDEKTPSFKIDPDLQNWHCFGCGKSGDVFGYLMESEHLEFPEAVRALADRANLEITEVGGSGVPRSLKDRMMQACAEAEEFYHMELMRSRDAVPRRHAPTCMIAVSGQNARAAGISATRPGTASLSPISSHGASRVTKSSVPTSPT